ncbi:MAG: translocation/assembly module TamB domain-containing protein [Bacteroides sp.]|nr:translocation/assembly module TamB domain-containing protein [Bacteroides sp.]MCM1446782.1 translocation/assembly module TamB domain-containing protein [Bacteroides sp.]
MKNLTRWLVASICGLYMVLQIAVYIPYIQETLGSVMASALKETYGWNVGIGRIRLGLWNRIIIDDITLKDQQDSVMLHASRLAAKINLVPLAKGQIRIANAQLFGTQVHIYQSTPNDKPNFQFIIDTFSSNDTTSSPIDLRIGSILLRRVSVDWNQQWKPRKAHGKLDPAHLQINDIAVTAHLKALTNDSLNLSLKRFSFTEEKGLSLKNLSFDLVAGKDGGILDNFCLQLPHSALSISSAKVSWPHFPKKGQEHSWIKNVSLLANISIHLTPSDLSVSAPWLENTPIDMEATVLFSEACLNMPALSIRDAQSTELHAKAFIYDLTGTPECTIMLERLRTTSATFQTHVAPMAPAIQKLSPVISRLDTIDISGRIQFTQQHQGCTLHINNKYGNLDINASAREWNRFDARASSDGLSLDRILSNYGNHAIGKTSFNITANGLVANAQGKPDINVHAILPSLQWQGREYNDLSLHAHLADNTLETKADLHDHGGDIHSHLTCQLDGRYSLSGNISMDNFHASRLGLGKRYPDTRLSVNTTIDLNGSDLDNVTGSVGIRDFLIQGNCTDSSTTIGPLSMSISTDVDKNQHRTLSIASAPLNLTASGRFRFSTIATTITNGLHDKLPNLVPYKRVSYTADTLHFSVSLQDTALIRRIALRDISIPRQATMEGSLYGYDSILVSGDIPELHIGSEQLRNGKISIHGMPGSVKTTLSAERRHKKGFVALSIAVDAHDDRLRLVTTLNNNRQPRISGELDITTAFSRNQNGKHDIRAWIAPSDFIVSDTVWRVHPCAITWNGQTAEIRGFRINQSAHRGIDINGRVSANAEDTLRVNLSEINVEYVMDLVNFKAVEFQGLATGSAYATGLLSSPHASADITVDGFAFNHAPLGTLQAKAGWGDTPHFLSLDATISEPESQHLSTISGGFNLGDKDTPDGLDLNINTQRFNLAFINLFTKDILEDFKGRSTGRCRIYGPFNAIDLEGDMMVDRAEFSMPMLGTAYHMQQDSVHIRPEEISITTLLYDKNATDTGNSFTASSHGAKSNLPHTAVLNGRLAHSHFKDMSYDFHVNANKFLGYDFKDFGESPFYATCIVSGDIDVQGTQGRLMVNINATPEQGTVFTYNVTTPDAITNADFITINSRDADTTEHAHSVDGTNMPASNGTDAHPAGSTASDLFLDFDLPITPAAKLRLLMDRKSGDMIEINGNGRIRAKYHNKGRFNIFGTYRVQDGTYRLSLQDIIRKEFKFQPGGTIVFGGDAMKADLNLKAVYSVNSVSLDDLTTSSLGFSKTKVDCIMNLTGHPEQPAITFDFDLPNATEDERQMVRSIVSTEEERNMQAIYLLGLGRFYNFEADGADQSSAAMNSLVSSTLSSHLNSLITTAVGSSNWRVSTYLQTTEDGWRNMDVEGQLSGSLLDNRLLLTGNFGYREKYYTQRNFISDVSIEYLLTRNGMLSVKAYNQANDRYFVQSSLNTQGIGLQYKKDFNRFTDLFRWLRPKAKQKEQ